MHQAREGGQIVQVKVIEFVKHQISTHQAQHRGNLAACALCFGGGHEVVNSADQQWR